ncbi:hypothetical protein BBP40_003346 [Aspergillus hancockii]|nr:hypothetical protein BBP40_003346 [Aspergillus hancockii]
MHSTSLLLAFIFASISPVQAIVGGQFPQPGESPYARLRNVQSSTGEEIPIGDIHIHPDYVKNNKIYNVKNDIAILELATPVEDIAPISLPHETAEIEPGSAVTIIGKGSTNEGVK